MATVVHETEIREYAEQMSVSVEDCEGRIVVKALNEGGYNCTQVDLLDLLSFVKNNMPDVWKDIE